MSYPLTLRFKRIAIARQVRVEDGSGSLLMYVKMKAFRLREAITIYGDEAQTRPLYHINADRVIDFSATYHITDASGATLGSIRQQGMRSIWRTRYDIGRAGASVFEMREENPWAKVGDALLGEIPGVNLLAGYVFNPKYLLTTADGAPVLRATKRPSLFEALFEIDRLETPLTSDDERLALIATVTAIILEKNRG